MFQFPAPPPLALYVHFPWCLRKCPYCDFNSHAVQGELPEGAYLDALLADLEQSLPAIWGRPVLSVFIGGGTPSLLSPEAVERLLSALRALLPLAPEAEITLEANPGTAEAGRFAAYRQAGINRLSLGIQSFHDEQLKQLGRIHDAAQAVAAAEAAHKAGFENFNLDLMFGLPGQDAKRAQADLARAIALAPSHLSYYQLTLEPNTAFHHAPPPLPDEEWIWAMQEAGRAQLAAAGYAQYEVSAYARPGSRCRHNLNYWQFGDYLGIGPGAHSKITDAPQQRITRLWRQRHPQAYLGGERLAGERRLGRTDAALEFMMNALRLSEGFDSTLFSAHSGLPLSVVEGPLREAEARGLLEWEVQRIRPSERGRTYLNDLLELFLPEGEES